MKELPVGIQTFKDIITGNYYYVDKTKFISKLFQRGKGYFFISRPRRFGKSLFISTLKSAFLGEKEYFKGLYLENNWDWSKKYPVIHISFGSGVTGNIEKLKTKLNNLIIDWKREYNIKSLEKNDIDGQFQEIIQILYKKYDQKVVILIDEYDKPILDMIDKTEEAVKVRDELKNFYSVIKDSDPYLKFVFLTGVTKFSKVSLFSGLNNLEDITLDKNYGDICGYNQEELETVFEDRLKSVDLKKLKKWYDGYNFLGKNVYNPFGILLFFSKDNIFQTYWFQTATPTFLIKLLQKNRYYIPDLENIEATEEIIGSFDIDKIEVETLLFQTGYLTIKEVKNTPFGTRKYLLKYPNLEVKNSLNSYIIDYLTDVRVTYKLKYQSNIYISFRDQNPKLLKNILFTLFASIPNDNYRKNSIANYEGYYASVLYAYFASVGLKIISEDVTNKGNIDLTIILNDIVYILEFKVLKNTPKTNTALKQIKERKYFEKYIYKYEKIYQIGIIFSTKSRNIVKFNYNSVKK